MDGGGESAHVNSARFDWKVRCDFSVVWRSCRISEPLLDASRIIPDEEKLRVYIQIVRLLLESGESGQAQTYFTRASLIIHGTESKEIQLSYRLCQVRRLAGRPCSRLTKSRSGATL